MKDKLFGNSPQQLADKAHHSLEMSKLRERFNRKYDALLNEIGALEFINKNIDDLLKAIDSHELKPTLHVQNITELVINDFSNTPDFVKIKNYLLKNPIYTIKDTDGPDVELSLDLITITNIMATYLTNIYFEKLPG